MNREPKKKQTIAIFQYDMDLGGVQRSLINLLNAIDYKHYDIDLYLVHDKNFFNKSIPDNVTIHTVKPLPTIAKILPFIAARQLFRSRFLSYDKEYDVAIDYSGYQHVTAIGALEVQATKRIMWFHGNHRARLKTDWRYQVLWLLQKAKYAGFDRAAVVSKGLVELVSEDTPFSARQIYVVNNYVDTEEIISLSQQQAEINMSPDDYWLVSVSRLAEEKGVDRSIMLHAKVLQRRSNVSLCVVGGGPDRAKLQSLVQELGTADKVVFVGPQPNPYAYMASADGYISIPRSEGQGISTVEAVCLGLEIFVPQELEAFTGVKVRGSSDLESAIVNARRAPKSVNRLHDYNQDVLKAFDTLMKDKE